jgi:signal transduction histidine kinase
VLLGRLRIRGKLALLVIVPLLAMTGLAVPVVVGLVNSAGRASEVATAVQSANRIGSLLQDLERERLLSVGYLLAATDRDTLVLETATVTDRVNDIRHDIGASLPASARDALDSVQRLASARQAVLSRTANAGDTIDAFAEVIDEMVDSLRLVETVDAATSEGRQVIALDALLRMDESNSESTALLAAMLDGSADEHADVYHQEVTERETYLSRFRAFATRPQNDLYDLVANAFTQRVGTGFEEAFDDDPVRAMAAMSPAGLFPSLDSFNVLGIFVEKQIIADVTAAVTAQQRRALVVGYGVGSVAVVVLLLVMLLAAAVARAVAIPLTSLTRSAEQVAVAGENELMRIADDDVEAAEPVRLDVLDVSARDEIGELARAFDRVQATAAQLVERQVLSRRNVAEMLGNIGRRTQNLVGRQVGLIDTLELEETDSPRLAQLYQLDHLSNRLRRNANSLVVLSGSKRADEHLAPVRLVDVARLALAEIEDYTRVDINIPHDVFLSPSVVSDIVLVCAELMENATTFSPPYTRVNVSARRAPTGVRLVVVDNGIGLSAERLAEENARLARRERLDLVPTQVLGLFVVGRLARRHGFRVTLLPTQGGGLTAIVELQQSLLASGAVELVSDPTTMLEATVEAGFGERWVVDEQTERPPAVAVPAALPAKPATALPARIDALSRVSGAISEWRPWNAFEIEPRQQVPVSPSGLRQRVPGAQLPANGSAPPVADVPDDADAARELIEAFEAGVQRASVQPVEEQPPPRSLSRRVPGATLTDIDPVGPRRDVWSGEVDQDPSAVRSLVEQFESGVARALRDATDSLQQERESSR